MVVPLAKFDRLKAFARGIEQRYYERKAVKNLPQMRDEDAVTLLENCPRTEVTNRSAQLNEALDQIIQGISKVTDSSRVNKSAKILSNDKALSLIFDLAMDTSAGELQEKAALAATQILDLSQKHRSKWLSPFVAESFPFVKDVVTSNDPSVQLKAITQFLKKVSTSKLSLQEALEATLGQIDNSFQGEVGKVFKQKFQGVFTQFVTDSSDVFLGKANNTESGQLNLSKYRDHCAVEFKEAQAVVAGLFLDKIPANYKTDRNSLPSKVYEIIAGYQDSNGIKSDELETSIRDFNRILAEKIFVQTSRADQIKNLQVIHNEALRIKKSGEPDVIFVTPEEHDLLTTGPNAVDTTRFTASVKNGSTVGYNLTITTTDNLADTVRNQIFDIQKQADKDMAILGRELFVIKDAFKQVSITDAKGNVCSGIEGIFQERVGGSEFLEFLFGEDKLKELAEKVQAAVKEGRVEDSGIPLVDSLVTIVKNDISSLDARIAQTEARIELIEKKHNKSKSYLAPISTASNGITSTDTSGNVIVDTAANSQYQKLLNLAKNLNSGTDIVNSAASDLITKLENLTLNHGKKAVECTINADLETINNLLTQALVIEAKNQNSQIDKPTTLYGRIQATLADTFSAAEITNVQTRITNYQETGKQLDTYIDCAKEHTKLSARKEGLVQLQREGGDDIDKYFASSITKTTLQRQFGMFADAYGVVYNNMTYNQVHKAKLEEAVTQYTLAIGGDKSDFADILTSILGRILKVLKELTLANN